MIIISSPLKVALAVTSAARAETVPEQQKCVLALRTGTSGSGSVHTQSDRHSDRTSDATNYFNALIAVKHLSLVRLHYCLCSTYF